MEIETGHEANINGDGDWILRSEMDRNCRIMTILVDSCR